MTFSAYWTPRGVEELDPEVGMIAWGSSNISGGTASRQLFPWFVNSSADMTDPTNASIVVTARSAIDKMYVRHGDPAGNGNPVLYTIVVTPPGGIATPTALAVSLASTGNIGSNLVDVIQIVPGSIVDCILTWAAATQQAPRNVSAQCRIRMTAAD